MANEQQQGGLKLNEYPSLKASGSASFQRLGPNTYQVLLKKYCQRSGVEQAPEVVQLTREALLRIREVCQTEIAVQQASIAGIDALVADIDASEPAQ